MSTPILNVSVLGAADIQGVSGKNQFCAYVRLQGQAMRTNTVSGSGGRVSFNERFRLQYRSTPKPVENRLSVELWNKSLFSQKCVSVGWIQLEQQRLVPRVPATFNVTGGFEGRRATVTVQLTLEMPGQMVAPQKPSGGAYPYQNYQTQQPYGAPPAQPAMGYQAPQVPQPAVGVPLMPQDPYTSANYVPVQSQPQPYVQAPYQQQQYQQQNQQQQYQQQQEQQYHQCTAAPLPPADDPPRPMGLPSPSYPPELYNNSSSPAL